MRQKPFAVFDLDGTLIRWQMFHALVYALGKRGLIPPAAHERIAQARWQWKIRASGDGFGEYEEVLVYEFRAALEHVRPEDFQAIAQEVFEEHKQQTYIYTRDMLRELKKKGYFLLAISGSQQEMVDKLANYYGFDLARGARMQIKDGKFTGVIDTPIFNKDEVLRELIAANNLSLKGSIAVGDSWGDLPLLRMVENPIAFNPDKKLFEAARRHGWKIVVERKNVVYELLSGSDSYRLQV